MTTPLTDEHKTFLLHPLHTGKLATVRKDGRPHVTPIWYEVDADTLVFTTAETSVKGQNMQRDPRICLCVDDERPPFSFMQIEGTVTLSEDPTELLRWATRIGGRYMGAELADAYGKRNGVPGELLVRLTPTRIIFAKDVANF